MHVIIEVTKKDGTRKLFAPTSEPLAGALRMRTPRLVGSALARLCYVRGWASVAYIRYGIDTEPRRDVIIRAR